MAGDDSPLRADILFLDHVAVLGGAELSLRDIARRFRDRAAVVLFTDGPLREALEQAGVTVEVVESSTALHRAKRDSGPLASLRASLGLLGLIRRLLPRARRARLLYANSQKAFIVAAILGRFTRRPVIWHLRDVLSGEHFSSVNRWVTTRLANRTGAQVIANSDTTRRGFIDAGGRAELATTIHNGLAAEPFDGVAEYDAAAVRRELGIAENALVVASFSRLAPWKGQHVLIDALATLPGVHALIVGEALFGEDDYKAGLHHRARSLGVADRVHWLGFRDDTARLMKGCDVIAHTSTAPEPFGRVIVEGMLARRPVIASDAGGAREIITSDAVGTLIQPDDAAALAEAIAALRDDPARRAALAEAGRAHAERSFSVENMLDRIEQFIEQQRQTTPARFTDRSPRAGNKMRSEQGI
jgi:glycosyltransferase involved in cell wall biosynthesis